jgi:hypothetical protein
MPYLLTSPQPGRFGAWITDSFKDFASCGGVDVCVDATPAPVLTAAAVEGVLPRPGSERVIFRAAEELVVARAAVDSEFTVSASAHKVIPGAPANRNVPAFPAKAAIIARSTEDYVRSRAAEKRVITFASIEEVVAGPAVKAIASRPAHEAMSFVYPLLPGTRADRVLSRPAIHLEILAVPCVNAICPASTAHAIFSRASSDHIVAGTAPNDVASPSADNHVGAWGPDDRDPIKTAPAGSLTGGRKNLAEQNERRKAKREHRDNR